jgi:hypothetical protein
LIAEQRGQVLRDEARTRHAEDRRLRLLALDVFFFGTAMSDPVGDGSEAPTH